MIPRLRETTTSRWLSFVVFVLAAALAATCKPSAVFGIRPGTVFVSVRDSFFAPDTIRVKARLPVRWTNEGTVIHTVVSDSGFFGSGLMAPAAWYEVRFDSLGAFPYHCTIHVGMIGTVLVEP